MADLLITPADVAPSSGAKFKRGTAGATITAGQVVYKDESDNLIKLADASALGSAKVIGIAANGASTGQPVTYITEDSALDLGATLAIGTIYVASATAGGIAPEADIGTGEFVSILGIANAADSLAFSTGPFNRATAAHA